jgi:4'-phosphopantetheinyl transferase
MRSLQIETDEVHIWAVVPRPALALTLGALLPADERERGRQFRFERDRQQYAVAHGCIRHLLTLYLGGDPSTFQFSMGSHGKPCLPHTALRFNLAHCEGLVLIAIAKGQEIGIDVENARAKIQADVISGQFFSVAERKQLAALGPSERITGFFCCWTLKEALLKAAGMGLRRSPKDFSVSLPCGRRRPVVLDTAHTCRDLQSWYLHRVAAPPGYVAALAVERNPCEFKYLNWADASMVAENSPGGFPCQ